MPPLMPNASLFSLVIAAPEPIRERFRGKKLPPMIRTAAPCDALPVGLAYAIKGARSGPLGLYCRNGSRIRAEGAARHRPVPRRRGGGEQREAVANQHRRAFHHDPHQTQRPAQGCATALARRCLSRWLGH